VRQKGIGGLFEEKGKMPLLRKQNTFQAKKNNNESKSSLKWQ